MARSSASLGSALWWSSTWTRVLSAGTVLLGLGAGSGCGADDGSGIGDGHKVQQPGDDAGVVQCEDGTTKACFVYLGEHNGVLSCYEGVQLCEDGRYGPCEEGIVVKRLRTSGPAGMRVMSLSDAGACEDNPCDPSCQVFDEEPDGGLSLETETQGPTWQTGPSGDGNWPTGWADRGIVEPCKSNNDCQHDQYCFEPETGPCAHSKCATGGALVPSCDSCVEAVCDVMPTCCAQGTATPTGIVFEDTFSAGNAKGWTLAGDWEIDTAKAGFNDPSVDTTPTGDEQLAGTTVGGKYSKSHNAAMTSPIIDTSGSGRLVLTLRSWERFYDGDDDGYLDVSTDGGSSWSQIYATSAKANEWKSLSFDLGSYRSTQFRMRFRLVSNGDNDADGGWSIDDVTITNTPFLFAETFSGLNSQGWTLQGEWEIGAAVAGSYDDPGDDTTSGSTDKLLAGTDIGERYEDNRDESMTTPTLDVAGVGPLTLTLRSWEQLESGYDTGRIYVSSNNGTSWTQIYSTSAESSSWKSLSFDISAHRSTQFKLRFRLMTDGSVRNGGWSLDDIFIAGFACRGVGDVCDASHSCCQGLSCSGGVCGPAWSADCIDKVGEVCGSYCPRTGDCDHAVCLEGGPLDSSCDTCAAQICALDPKCCTDEWDAYCVAKVGPVCNQTCAPLQADCRPFNPGEVNPYCSETGKPDLTAGVPCGNTVPICNRGDATLPANTAYFFFIPGASADSESIDGFTECEVAEAPPTASKRCPIYEAIPAGECRNLVCDSETINAGGIAVNPIPGTGFSGWYSGKYGGTYTPVAECNCQNNWTWFKKSPAIACGQPSCLSTTVEAKIPTVNMFITFDKSGSMCAPQDGYGCYVPGATTRWGLTTSALKSFVRDPGSAGMRVALRFFPGYDATLDTTCGGHCYTMGGQDCYTACDTGGCVIPQVDLGPLLGTQVADPPPSDCAGSGDAQECALLKVINANYPNGGTPISEALDGATTRMGNYLADHPFERGVVVLFTDGEAGWCNTDPDDIAAIADAAYKNWGVVTYAVGLAEANSTLLTNIAEKGRGQAFFLSTNNTSADLVGALNAIRANSVSCDLVLNSSMGIDPANVDLNFTPSGSATAVPFDRVSIATDCSTSDHAFYYDDNQNPTKITLCPNTCARVRADVNSTLDLEIGCPTSMEAKTYAFPYSATCPPGTKAQWGQLTWAATTPGNSFIRFEGRTSEDINSFATPPVAGELSNLGTAHANVAPFTGDTQACTMFGPAPDCPADLFVGLGMPDAYYSHLELFVTLNPSTTGAAQAPELQDWNVTYSCVDSE